MYFRNFGKFTVIPCTSGFVAITQQRVNRRAARVSERLTGCMNINASVIMRSKNHYNYYLINYTRYNVSVCIYVITCLSRLF
jgi:hypothetical protein